MPVIIYLMMFTSVFSFIWALRADDPKFFIIYSVLCAGTFAMAFTLALAQLEK